MRMSMMLWGNCEWFTVAEIWDAKGEGWAYAEKVSRIRGLDFVLGAIERAEHLCWVLEVTDLHQMEFPCGMN